MAAIADELIGPVPGVAFTDSQSALAIHHGRWELGHQTSSNSSFLCMTDCAVGTVDRPTYTR